MNEDRRSRPNVHFSLIFVLFVLHSVIVFIPWELSTGVNNNNNNNNLLAVGALRYGGIQSTEGSPFCVCALEPVQV